MRVMLVGIGAPKCATSWVHDNLRHHPKITANPIKEIHYFDQAYGTDPSPFPRRIIEVQEIYKSYRDSAGTTPNTFALEWLERYLSPVPMDDQWYLSLFEHVPDDSVGMDVSPGYSTMSMEGFQHLRRTLPNARILFQMRNPIERCWSQFRRDVIEVINKPLSTDHIIRLLEKPEYVYSSYGQTLEYLFRTFDKREVMCAFYEDIIEGPTDFMQSLCEFLEIDFDLSHFPELDRRSNETGIKDAMPQEVREHLRKKHHKTYEMVAAHLGRVPLNWQKEFGHHVEPVLPAIGSDRNAGADPVTPFGCGTVGTFRDDVPPDVQRTVVFDPEPPRRCQREQAIEQKPCSFGLFDQIALKALIERATRPNCVMAEIGCWLGEGSTQVFLSTMPETGKLLRVDTWRGSPNVRQHQEFVSRENVLNSFMAKLEATRGSIEVQSFVSSSVSAASLIRDKSLDLVFIDADHSYGAVRQDILAWMPKVKSGGIICGHDCETRPDPQLQDRLWSAKDDDVVDGTGTTFPVIHPGPILAVHETLEGKANLCADDVVTVNGGQGRSSIWWKRVSHYPDDFDNDSLDAGL